IDHAPINVEQAAPDMPQAESRERIAGATAHVFANESAPAQPKSSPLSVFDDDECPASDILENASEAEKRADNNAPLDALFGDEQRLVGSEIDRKIDEALETAERMKAENGERGSDDDDLDVP